MQLNTSTKPRKYLISPSKILIIFSFVFENAVKLIRDFLNSSFFFDFMNFSVGLIAGLILNFSKTELVKNYIPDETVYLIVSITILILLVSICFYFKFRRTQKKHEGFKNINEIMNISFQYIYSFFIDKMLLIKESNSGDKIEKYLKEINSLNLLRSLTESLHKFIEDLLSDNVETKIDIFKYQNDYLEPILNTLINGAVHNHKSESFQVVHTRTEYSSLAEFAYSRNKIGYINKLKETFEKLNKLGNHPYKKKLISKKNLYFDERPDTAGFFLGSILCFPLKSNGDKFGVLSIGFMKDDIEPDLKKIGITIEDFKRSISTYIEKYTKFVLYTTYGVNNIVDKYAKAENVGF